MDCDIVMNFSTINIACHIIDHIFSHQATWVPMSPNKTPHKRTTLQDIEPSAGPQKKCRISKAPFCSTNIKMHQNPRVIGNFEQFSQRYWYICYSLLFMFCVIEAISVYVVRRSCRCGSWTMASPGPFTSMDSTRMPLMGNLQRVTRVDHISFPRFQQVKTNQT